MEELQLLIQTVAGLPTLTLWVLGGYLVYKLAILGSLYGTIRYLADKFVEWRAKPTTYNLNGVAINEGVAASLTAQLHRLSNGGYIHSSAVVKLKEAIDAMEARK